MIRDPHDKPESKYNPDAGMSKEDEDKYKRLIEENKQLATKIREVRPNNSNRNYYSKKKHLMNLA